MIRFDEEKHQYWDGGQLIPSVTQILKPVSPNFGFVVPEKLEQARLLGSAVDSAITLHEQKVLDESSLVPVVREYLNAWIEFKTLSGWITSAVQERVYHRAVGYAGTLDIRGMLNGRPAVIDVKRTFVMPASVGPQTAAYAKALGSDHDRFALHLKPRNSKSLWVLERLDDPTDWVVFMSCLTVYRFREKHKC